MISTDPAVIRRYVAAIIDNVLAFMVPWAAGDALLGTGVGSLLTLFVLSPAYFAVFEASPWQGTPGKRLLGLAVADMRGRRLSWKRAAARSYLRTIYLSIGVFAQAFGVSWSVSGGLNILAGLVIIGTPHNQAPHDLLAGALVRRRASDRDLGLQLDSPSIEGVRQRVRASQACLSARAGDAVVAAIVPSAAVGDAPQTSATPSAPWEGRILPANTDLARE
ncbi:MAG: RDD family protein [Chloroflexota bacterium]